MKHSRSSTRKSKTEAQAERLTRIHQRSREDQKRLVDDIEQVAETCRTMSIVFERPDGRLCRDRSCRHMMSDEELMRKEDPEIKDLAISDVSGQAAKPDPEFERMMNAHVQWKKTIILVSILGYQPGEFKDGNFQWKVFAIRRHRLGR